MIPNIKDDRRIKSQASSQAEAVQENVNKKNSNTLVNSTRDKARITEKV